MAQSGSKHWKSHRVTALLLIPASLLFLYPFINSFGGSQSDVLITYANPVNAMIALLFFGTLSVHLYQGLHEVIVDYAHSGFWLRILHLCNALFSALLGIAAFIAIARIALFP